MNQLYIKLSSLSYSIDLLILKSVLMHMQVGELLNRYNWFWDRTVLQEIRDAQRISEDLQLALEQILGINIATNGLGVLESQLDMYYAFRRLNYEFGGEVDLDIARRSILSSQISWETIKRIYHSPNPAEGLSMIFPFLEKALPENYFFPFELQTRQLLTHEFDDLSLLLGQGAVPGYTLLSLGSEKDLHGYGKKIAFNMTRALIRDWSEARHQIASAFEVLQSYEPFIPLIDAGGEKFQEPYGFSDAITESPEIKTLHYVSLGSLDDLFEREMYKNNVLLLKLFEQYLGIFDRTKENKFIPGRFSQNLPLKRSPAISIMLERYRRTINDLTLGDAAQFYKSVDVYRTRNRLSTQIIEQNVIGLYAGLLNLSYLVLFSPAISLWMRS